MTRNKKIILSIAAIVIAAIVICISYFKSQLNKVNKVEIPKSNTELKISDEAAKLDPQIINIAFYGVDRRFENEASRSDAIMIVTIDQKHKKIKLASIMRDCYVNIEGHGKTKLNHAYAYGGPTLSIKTLNNLFDLNLRDYVTVDFYGLEKIIDSLGGVTLNLSQEEVKLTNDNIYETAHIEKVTPPLLTKAGVQTLNGMQAVAYARVRYTAGGDAERTQRQRTIVTLLLEKIKTTNLINISNVISQLLPYTETSMSNAEILKSFTSVYTYGITSIEQDRFPRDGYCQGKMIDGIWYWVFDLEATKSQLHKFIYEQ